MKIAKLFLCSLILFSTSGFAALENENLIQIMPKEYQVAYQDSQNQVKTVEMIPQAQQLESWSEMITSQILEGQKDISLEQFKNSMASMWLLACDNSQVVPVKESKENGYDAIIWFQGCPLNKATGLPENIWFKAIKGNDNFYVVQKEIKVELSESQITEAMQYLAKIYVCDTRLPERPC